MRIDKYKAIKQFFATKQVFTWRDFSCFLISLGTTNEGTQKQILNNHLKAKRITRIRRELFLSVGDAFLPENAPADPYLISGKAADDAVVAYHSALELHGEAYSVFFQSAFLTGKNIMPFSYREHDYIPTRFPFSLVEKNKIFFECDTVNRGGVSFKVTSLERAFVDVLDRPNISGGWEEVIRSLDGIQVLDIDKVVQYAVLLDNSLVIKRAGYLLEAKKEHLHIEERLIKKLEKHVASSQQYFDRSLKDNGKNVYMKRWNLVVPEEIHERQWEEF